MKKRLIAISMAVIIFGISNITVIKAENEKVTGCKVTSVHISGTIKNNGNKKKVFYVIKTYNQLKSVRKKIKKGYSIPKKVLKKLKNYKRSYFKKNMLCVVSIQYFDEHYDNRLVNITKNKNVLTLDIEKEWKYDSDVKADTMVKYNFDTFFISLKKKKAKKVNKVKVKYSYKTIQDSADERETTKLQ